MIKKAKYTVPWTHVTEDINEEEIVGTFYEKELQKTNQTEFIVQKRIKGRGDKLYFKWKGSDNSFKSWIDKKRYRYIKRIIFQKNIPKVKTK